MEILFRITARNRLFLCSLLFFISLPTLSVQAQTAIQNLRKTLDRTERTVIGPNVGENGTQYELSQATGMVTWSTTDTDIASIDQNGVLSVKGKGLVTLIAVCQGSRYSKQILVGLPRYILSATYEPGGYQVRAACIDPEFKDRLPEVNTVITYRWGIKYPGKDIEWVDTYEENLCIGLINGEPETTVFLKVMDPLGNASTTQSVKVASRDIYYARNQKLYISDNGKLYDAENLSYVYKMSSVYIKYLPDLPDEYKKTKWMVTTADVISPFSGVRRIRVTPYAAIYDILPLDEFDFIKNAADENRSYTYMLVLRNASYSVIQFFPVVFSYKKQ